SYGYGKLTKPVQDKLWELITESSSKVREASATTIIRNGLFKEEDFSILLKAAFKISKKSSGTYSSILQFRDLLTLAGRASTPQSFKLIMEVFERLLLINEAQFDEDMGLIRLHLFMKEENPKFIKELIMHVISHLKSDITTVRLNALFIWGNMRYSFGNSTLLSQLINVSQILPLLNDNDSWVKIVAIRWLNSKDMGSLDVIEALDTALQDDDIRVRKVSMRALRQTEINSINIVNKLIDILKSSKIEEVIEASLTLSKVKNIEIRQKVAMEAEKLISSPLQGQYAFDILWNL